jgi:hypothetical protein
MQPSGDLHLLHHWLSQCVHGYDRGRVSQLTLLMHVYYLIEHSFCGGTVRGTASGEVPA